MLGLVVVAAVVGNAVLFFKIGAAFREKDLIADYVLLPKKGMFAEFSISASDLADLYTREQLRDLKQVVGWGTELEEHIRRAMAIRAARDVVAEMDIGKK